jgi:Cdc6-like AAA superfamily ATPase
LSLFSTKELNICLIGVSNSIDALEKYNEKVASLYQIKNLVFAPYTQQIIGNIITDRLYELKEKCQIEIVISEKLLNYLARKLENVTKGDIRIVNEFVRDLVLNVIAETEIAEQEQEECKENVHSNITINDLEKIFRKMEHSREDLIQSLPFAQQLLLVGINAVLNKEELLYLT